MPRVLYISYWGALEQLGQSLIVPAVKNNRFYASAGGATLTRPGPRLAEAVEQLARYLHPELFPASAGSGTH